MGRTQPTIPKGAPPVHLGARTKDMLLRQKLFWALTLGLALALLGCAGSHASHPISIAAQGTLTLFATDDFSDDYSAVWVRVYQVDLVDSGGVSVTVFSSKDGETINLSALSDGQPIYKLLGTIQVPVNTYVLANVIVNPELRVVPRGSRTAQVVFFDSGFSSSSVRSRIPVRFDAPLLISRETNLTLDFDLSQWRLIDGTVIPVVVNGKNDGILDPSRHTSGIAKGFISCLTGPLGTRHFILTFADGRSVSATTNSSTIIYHEDGTGNPVLVDKQLVEITGTYDPTTRTVAAAEIQIDDYTTDQKVVGPVEWMTQYAMKVNVRFLSGLFPYETEISVRITSDTQTYISGGLEISMNAFLDYYNAITNSGPQLEVEVEGQYDEGTRTLVATRIRAKGTGGVLKVFISSLDQATQSLTGVVQMWSGFELTQGLNVTAQFDASTQFYDNQSAVTAAQFFQTVQPDTKVSLTTKGVDRWGWFGVARVDFNNR